MFKVDLQRWEGFAHHGLSLAALVWSNYSLPLKELKENIICNITQKYKCIQWEVKHMKTFGD